MTMPEEERQIIRRFPYIETRVSDINRAKGRIAIIGTIVRKDEDNYTFVLNDGKAQVLIITNNTEEFNKLATGKLARVLGKPIGEGTEIEILADIVQDFSSLDKDFYDKAS